MEYNFRKVEKKWQKNWAEKKTFKVEIVPGKEKYYVLDMFPYPSGAGLHVGHPLGYIASDIYARYKRLCGYNVLHPMGYDAFGLPAEQYAIQTGQHPAITTEQNIKRYRQQLDQLGFSFDWDREIRTADPDYYKWTQWIFLKLFNSWYNPGTDKAESIETLIRKLEAGNWQSLNEKEKSEVLMNHRLAYLSEAVVNWCPALGTVLANDEVKDGVSERGGYPVERKKMKQWSLRITDFAQRLLDDLETIDWSEALKEQQRNWIGRSEGSSLTFAVQNSNYSIEVFTTRPDTVFGVTFLTLAPENELIEKIVTPEYIKAADEYVHYAKNRSERDRQSEVKNITGQFTGAYAIHPFSEEKIPIWIGDYVLIGYGTGAVMGVPAHDTRDYAFAKHFSLPVKKVIDPNDKSLEKEECFDTYDGYAINSDFINGLQVKEAIKKIIGEIEKRGLGKGKVNYRLRDAVFGRQRYWGEPIPIYYKDGIPHAVDEKDLPVVLPEVDKFLPTEDGEPPLARAKNWKYRGQYDYEHTTMPGWAGSSWYFLRYMDANNDKEFASKEALSYWKDVDLYIGGSEHATGHLLYFRFWTKLLYDLEYISIKEPAKKLINQGMIQGTTMLAYSLSSPGKIKDFIDGEKVYEGYTKMILCDKDFKNNYPDIDTMPAVSVRIPIDQVVFQDGKYYLTKDNLEKIKVAYPIFSNSIIKEDAEKIELFYEIEKMSKSKYNVVSPDDIVETHGADALRLYEMFLGPLELSKPWNTNGLSGTSSFIRKLWRLYHKGEEFSISNEAASKEELKSLHKLIKKVTEDIERFSFNTSVSNFMICVNELTDLKCNKRAVLEPLAILVSPYAPHIAEELWEKLGHKETITYANWPKHNEEYLTENSFAYPISINGKTKTNLDLSLTLSKEEVETEVLKAEEVRKYLHGQTPKKVIVVPGRIVNIVI